MMPDVHPPNVRNPKSSDLGKLRCASLPSAAGTVFTRSRGTVVHPVLERRKFGRGSNCAQGWIRAQGRPLIVCKVRNRTPAGALLEFDKPGWLPFRFELLIEDPKEFLVCELRHVLSSGVGVYFIATATEADRAHKLSNSATASDDWTGKRSTGRSSLLARI